MESATLDLNTATFQELRKECNARDIKFSRRAKKKELVELLQADSVSALQQQSKIITEGIDEELYDLGIDKAPYVITEPKTSDGHSLSDVLDECNALFNGRAQAQYNKDNPQMIEFHGGPRQRYDVTIAQPKKAILMFARTFCSPALVGKRNTGRLGLPGENPLEDLNVESMTPQQRKAIAEQLRAILGD